MAEEEEPEGDQQVQMLSSKDQSVTAAKANNKGLQEKKTTQVVIKSSTLVFPRKIWLQNGPNLNQAQG
jgi:hypothetical protein